MTKSPARLIDIRRAPHICISWACQENCTVNFINLALDLLQLIIFASFIAFSYRKLLNIEFHKYLDNRVSEKILIDFGNFSWHQKL